MAIVASGYGQPDGSAVVTFVNTEPFSTTAWEVKMIDVNLPSVVTLMYGMIQSGNGVLSGNNRVLTIAIPFCPFNDFTVAVGSFKKVFNLSEGENGWLSQFSIAPSFGVRKSDRAGVGLTGLRPMTKGLILFSNETAPPTRGSNHVASLYKGKRLVGYAIGVGFHNALTEFTPRERWPYSGVVFTKFVWVSGIPETVETVEIRLSLEVRGGGTKSISKIIQIDSNGPITPASPIFTILPNHTFIIDGDIA